MKFQQALVIAGLLSAMSGPVRAQCLDYEPKVVNLSGTLVRQTFPGPPNYQSIARGDKAETFWILRLRKPVCVNVADHFDIHEEGQKQIQLVLEPKQYKQFRRLLGKRVTATGSLFHAHTAHHRKPLLFTTSEIRKTVMRRTRRDSRR
jgi:hypothetical protein